MTSSELVRAGRAYTAVELYDRAVLALEAATTLVEAKGVHDMSEALKLQGRLARDREAIARAMELGMRAKRRLGEMIVDLKERGELHAGGRPSRAGGRGAGIRLDDVGIDWKLSSEAQKLFGYDQGQFETVLGQGLEKIRARGAVVINPVKDLNTADKKLHRAVREAQLAARQQALPDKKYGVILADPEWPFDVWSAAGMDRAADNHYPTSALSVIEARDVPSIAHQDCVLFLWVTAPHHAAGNGAMILRAWGFEPKAEIIWDKIDAGTGFWFRNQHEILLVGTRGKVPAPALGTQLPSIIRSPKGAHSEKPDWQYDLIEAYFPNLSKIELNARRRRAGWDAWGFEAPEDEIAAPPETGSGQSAAPGAGVGGPVTALLEPSSGSGPGQPLPHADVPVADLTPGQQDDIIRAGYAAVPRLLIPELMQRTGLTRDQIKKRATRKLKIADPANQRDAARQLMGRINDERKAVA